MKIKQSLLLMLKGMAMGAADVVPGVSGGTIAFITGIYDELLHSISRLTPNVLLILKDEGFVRAWNHINGNFLATLFIGILVSVFSFARVIEWGLSSYPILVWAFFFGLIVASIIHMGRRQHGWKIQHWLSCLIGAGLVYVISIAAPAQLPGHWWILFLGGFVAISAMILPGVSGSFLLLLMGLYPVVLAAINDLDLLALGSLGLGCIVGLLSFSRLLAWLLDKYHTLTLATLIGFLVGSLNVTWPWKHTVQSVVDRHGEVIPLVQKNVLPISYNALTGQDPTVMYALAFFAFGVLLVLFTDIISLKFGRGNEK